MQLPLDIFECSWSFSASVNSASFAQWHRKSCPSEPSSESSSEECKSSRGHSKAFCNLCKHLHDCCQHSFTDIMFTKMLKFRFNFRCGSLDFAFVILVQICWHGGFQWVATSPVLSAVGLNGQIFFWTGIPATCWTLALAHRNLGLSAMEQRLKISVDRSNASSASSEVWCEQGISFSWSTHQTLANSEDICFRSSWAMVGVICVWDTLLVARSLISLACWCLSFIVDWMLAIRRSNLELEHIQLVQIFPREIFSCVPVCQGCAESLSEVRGRSFSKAYISVYTLFCPLVEGRKGKVWN